MSFLSNGYFLKKHIDVFLKYSVVSVLYLFLCIEIISGVFLNKCQYKSEDKIILDLLDT